MILNIKVVLGMFFVAFLGHSLCAYTDCLLAYTPNGRFDFSNMKDSENMRKTFENMPQRNIILSILLGVLAFSMEVFGYIALSDLMSKYSKAAAFVMFVAAVLHFISITAHHICCGVVEWFYVRMNRTDEALETVLDFFKKTSITIYSGYLTLLVFVITFLVMVVTGNTDFPRWACIFNTLPLFIVLSPTKIPAKGNVAGEIMFFALFVLGLVCLL